MTTQHPMSRTTLGPHFSEGARQLWRVVERGVSQEEIRRAIGLGRGMVHRFLYGDRKMSLDVAVRIETAFGIRPALWLEPSTRPFDPSSVFVTLAKRAARAQRRVRHAA
jgi:transcriptional regulator with XRE-family HTH domain